MKKFNNIEEILNYLKTEYSSYYIEKNEIKSLPSQVISITYELYKKNTQACKKCKFFIKCNNIISQNKNNIYFHIKCEQIKNLIKEKGEENEKNKF